MQDPHPCGMGTLALRAPATPLHVHRVNRGKEVGFSGPPFLAWQTRRKPLWPTPWVLGGALRTPGPSCGAQGSCSSLGAVKLKAQGPALGDPQKDHQGCPMPNHLSHPALPGEPTTLSLPLQTHTGKIPPDFIPSGVPGKGPWPFLLPSRAGPKVGEVAPRMSSEPPSATPSRWPWPTDLPEQRCPRLRSRTVSP